MDSGDQGYKLLNDEQIISVIQSNKKCDANTDDDDSNDETDTSINIPSHGQVHNMLTLCLPRIEKQPEVSASHICAVNNLIELAAINIKQIN